MVAAVISLFALVLAALGPHRPRGHLVIPRCARGEHALEISGRLATALKASSASSRDAQSISHEEPRATYSSVCPSVLCSSHRHPPLQAYRSARSLRSRHGTCIFAAARRDDYPPDEECSGLHLHSHTGICSEYLLLVTCTHPHTTGRRR